MAVSLGFTVFSAIGFSGGTVAAGIVGGAIIGAAIGGLTSLVTGGNIWSGMLYGAIGGAVLGGLQGFVGLTAFDVGVEAGVGFGGSSGMGTSAPAYETSIGAVVGDSSVAAGAASEGLSEGAGLLGAAAVTAGGQGLGSIFEGISAEKMAKQTAAAEKLQWEKESAWQAQQNALDRESSLSIAEANLSAAEAEIEEAARQFDITQAWTEYSWEEEMEEQREQFYYPYEVAEESRQRASNALASFGIDRGGSYTDQASIYEGMIKQRNEGKTAAQQAYSAPKSIQTAGLTPAENKERTDYVTK